VLSGIFFDPPPTNTAPTLSAISDKYVHLGQTVAFTATATDAQSAYQTLTFSLTNSPPGASIDPATGVFFWATTNALAPSTNSVTVLVTDNGSPPLSDAKTFSVVIAGPLQFIGTAPQAGGQLQFSFNTLPGQNYQVQFKSNLTEATWISLDGLISGTGLATSISDNMTGNLQRFYRLLAFP
jgi:hypothetical protein